MLKYAGLLPLSALPLALLWSNPYWVNILAYTYLFAALAAAWNIIGGFGGQFSLGHGVFFAIGAYHGRALLSRSRRDAVARHLSRRGARRPSSRC